MDRVAQRVTVAKRALATLRELDLTGPDPTTILRDAAIQRFEYTFEAVWKAAKGVMESEGIEIASPRDAIRAAFRAGLLDEAQGRAAMAMASDRNLTVHTYSEDLAARLFARLAGHAELLSVWLSALEAHVQHNNDDLEPPQ